jgi:uncharacterized protein YegL
MYEATQPRRRPGGTIAKRDLEFFWICDTSGSMAGRKIESLNFAMKEALGAMRERAHENPNANVFVRIATFDDDARWITPERTPLESLRWRDLKVDRGLTAMGAALDLVAQALEESPEAAPSYPPVLVLTSDGMPTDTIPGLPTFAQGLKRVLDSPLGRHAVRLAIAIGDEADLDVLAEFIGDPSLQPLRARTAGELVNYVRWASSAGIVRSTTPKSGSSEQRLVVPMPILPADAAAEEAL